jgi:hypothetical protein
MKRKHNPKSSPSERLTLVRETLNTQYLKIESKRKRAHRFMVIFTSTQLVALAATPIFLGLSSMLSFNWYTATGLVLSAVASLSAGFLAVFSFRERWKSFVRVSGALQELKLTGELLQFSSGQLSSGQVEEFRVKYLGVLNRGNEQWLKAIVEAKNLA